MPRPRYDDGDEYGDYRDGPPQKSSSSGLILGLVIGGGVLVAVLLIGCAVSMFLFRGAAVNAPQGAQPVATRADQPEGKVGNDAAKKTYTRVEFMKLVMGKKPDEVIAAVGKPDDKTENALKPDSPVWYYKRTTINPASGELDHSAQVVFEKGVVSAVNCW